MRLLITGPPGVGKGTQSALLAAGLGVPAISTGDMFRALQAGDGALGEEVREVMASGRYVDDALTNRVVTDRLARADCDGGFLLDGYPRTTGQLRFLDELLARDGHALDAVVALTAEPDVLARRMAARALLDGRADDTEEAFRVRLHVYEEQTRPLLDEYARRDLLREIDGTGSVDEVAARIAAAVHAEPAVSEPSAPFGHG